MAVQDGSDDYQHDTDDHRVQLEVRHPVADVVDEIRGESPAHDGDPEERQEPAALLEEGVLESVLDGFVVDRAHVSDEQVHQSHVDGELHQESDPLGSDLAHTVALGEDSLEDGGQVVKPQKLLPRVRDTIVGDPDEVHSEAFSEEQQSEDERPDPSEEECRRDDAPVLAARDPQAVRTDDYEGYGIPDVSDHEPEEQGEEDRDQDGRVNLLILGHRHELRGVLELLRHVSVVHLSRRLSESGLDLLDSLQGPSAGLLDLHVDALDLGLDLGFDRLRLLLGHPGIDEERVLAGRDPEGYLTLLDLDRELLLRSLEEVLVFLKKALYLLVRALLLRLEGGDLTVGLSECVGRRSGPRGDGDLGEPVLRQDRSDLFLVLHLGEDGDYVALLLVEGREDLTIDAREGSGGVSGNGSDD